MKRICIYGLGAVGGLMAARLAAAGVAVNAVARGPTLAAIQSNGIELRETISGRSVITRHALNAAEAPAELGVQDLVVLAVKTTGMQQVAAEIGPLLGKHTTVLSAMNGVPWWFLHGMDPELARIGLNTVDPQRVISQAIDPASVIGCVTHLSAAAPAPGVVQHVAGHRLIMGEPMGAVPGPRCEQTMNVFRTAGFEVEPADSIQREIWFKLWGNMTVNPISALTGATGDLIMADDLVRAFMSRCMLEAAAIGRRIGLPIEVDPEERHAVTSQLGAFRTSMLQDAEAGKPLELDALVAAVVEIARQLQIPTPQIDTLLGLARLKARVAGMY
ncbi:2-dehydropantoate 2-reductase [Hydrogenophaga sp.]|uniref:2-dehydropantoate 2-reductase n=1 Tax=Hydrogenophaga sp. TaxID=1904254 RepID=UPI003F6F8A69